MKGIVLAGGSGTRLHPTTLAVSKQLLPVYNKPMIYYSLSVLMLAGITDILIITTPADVRAFERLLGDGSIYGLKLSYAEQVAPNGIAEAFRIGATHVGNDSVALILGDNFFHGPRFSRLLQDCAVDLCGCVLFGYPVADPWRYGIGEVDENGRLVSIEEKPEKPRSNLAITGLYMYDNDVVDIASRIIPSARGELEITDVNQAYVSAGRAKLADLGRGFAWLDAGTFGSLQEAGRYVQVLEERQGVKIACLEEISLRMGYISSEECYELGRKMQNSDYGAYVMEVAGVGLSRDELD